MIPKKLDKKVLGKKITNFKNIENLDSKKQFSFNSFSSNTGSFNKENNSSPFMSGLSGASPAKLTPGKLGLFQVEPSKIAIGKQNPLTTEFKEKLVSLESELMSLSEEFYKSLDSNDLEEFIRVLKNFKYLCRNYNFENLMSKVEEWEKTICEVQDLSELKINYEDVSKLLITMGECANRFASNSGSANSNILSNNVSKKNSILNLNNLKSTISMSNTNQSYEEANPAHPGSIQSNFGTSPAATKRSIAGTKPSLLFNQVTLNKNDEDLIYQELKPIKFDGLFRKDMTPEEIAEIIKKIEQEVLSDSQPATKIGGASRGFKGANLNTNVVTENAYPFKQDCFKISCNIF
jgi:hypothetical protein